MTERSVPEGAREFIIERLEMGTPLTAALTPTIRSGIGSVTALVPEDIRDAPITAFGEGLRELGELTDGKDGSQWERVITATDDLAEHAYEFLSARTRGLFVIAATSARAADRYLNDVSFPIVTDGDDVYFTLSNGTPLDTIGEAIRAGSSWNSISFLGIGDASSWKEAVQTAAEVHVGTFDGEGYLVWRRNPLRG